MTIQEEIDKVFNYRAREKESLRKLARKINKVPKGIFIPAEYMS